MKLASVILDIPTQALDAPYTYALPAADGEDSVYAFSSASAQMECLFGDDTLAGSAVGSGAVDPVEVGCAVLVPFGRRQAVGFVIDVFEAGLPGDETWPSSLDARKLKSIVRGLSKPYFDEEGAACAQWLANRYIAPLSSCVRLFTPPGGIPRMVHGRDGRWRLEEQKVGEVDDRWVVAGPELSAFEPRKNAVRQEAIVAAVRTGELRVSELSAQMGAISSTLRALESKGVVRIVRRRRMRGADGALGSLPGIAMSGTLTETSDGAPSASASIASSIAFDGFTPSLKPALTPGQESALAAIDRAREHACGEVVVVDGVTGSGKTELYLRAIEKTLAEGRTACVLVPEISLTPQTVGRFRGRFGDLVAVMHSRMSQGERYDQWDFIKSGAARVVVGARSALFTPLSNIGLIVIDEEHEGSYKQDSAPRYDAREVARWMVERSGGVLVMGSATPSIEALYACEQGGSWTKVDLPDRANGKPLPAVEVVDMAAEFRGGSRAMFSRKLVEGLRSELSIGRKAVLLLNQRGFAKFLLCRDCGFVPTCPSCDTSLTYHERGRMLVCHHCGHTEIAPAVCPECGSPYLKKFGAGTQRVEAELRALLDGMPGVGPDVPIIRMDADTTSGKGAHERLLEQFAGADAAVLLGTQMIAKGLDFEDVTIVGVINADTQLHLPDYRAAERTFSLIEQVAGRAGRADLPGRVLVQTYEADNVAIRAAATYDRERFLRAELPKRRILLYPPFVRMANVLVWGRDEPSVRTTAERLFTELEAHIRDFGGDGWSVLPASPCVLAKLRGVYRWHVVVKCPPEDDLSRVIAPLFRARVPEADVNVAVDVDPNDLL
ncbi:replication restart helicase PriA [Ellagibacter isourolithinifaciens]|uniref:replication restart helicase PriA n=1 Tax=Ellagibacter isourolithinifaciens TaxID=2137581 RepID=UPI003A95D82A